MFLDRIKNEGQDLQAVKEAYDALHQKHTELSSLAKVQAQQICELKVCMQKHTPSSLKHTTVNHVSINTVTQTKIKLFQFK